MIDAMIIQYAPTVAMLALCVYCGYGAAKNRPEYQFLGKFGKIMLIVQCSIMAIICVFVLVWGAWGAFLQ